MNWYRVACEDETKNPEYELGWKWDLINIHYICIGLNNTTDLKFWVEQYIQTPKVRIVKREQRRR